MALESRYLQFNLRTLIWLTVVVAAFFGGWQANEWKQRRELENARRIYTGLQGPIRVTPATRGQTQSNYFMPDDVQYFPVPADPQPIPQSSASGNSAAPTR